MLVLCYHAVSDRWDSPLAVRPDRLAQHLDWLVRRGYRGVTFTEAVTAPPAGRTFAVTFDDGYRSVLEQALPILDRLGLPGTIFVATEFVGRAVRWPGVDQWLGGPHEPELVTLSWPELRQLRDTGWEIGSHTRSHPRLSRLDDDAVQLELVESRTVCETQLGACRSIALPYGDGDDRVVALAREAGYDAVAGLPGAGMTEPVGWPRVGIYPPDGLRRFRVKVAPPVRRWRASAAARRLEATVRRR